MKNILNKQSLIPAYGNLYYNDIINSLFISIPTVSTWIQITGLNNTINQNIDISNSSATIKHSGVYLVLISFFARFNSNPTTGRCGVSINNSDPLNEHISSIRSQTTTVPLNPSMSFLIKLSINDVIDFRVIHDSAVNTFEIISCNISILKISD